MYGPDEITIKDVAKACGVGVSTVSRAINNHPDINEETKNLVMDKIKEIGYIPNNSARNLKRTDAKSIAVLVKGMNNPFFTDMIKIMEAAIVDRHYSLVLQHVDPNEDEVDAALELTKEKRLCGLIFLGGIFSRNEEKIHKLQVPYVLSTVGCPLENIGRYDYSSVAVDDEKEAYKVTKYLIGKGHKRIALLAAARGDTSIGMLRLNGYKRALEEANIPFDKNLVRFLPAGFEEYSMENGRLMTEEMMREGIDFSAIFAIADVMAVGACKALLTVGKRIPEDVAVIGFDGIPLTEFYTPGISTLAQPTEEIAEETVRLLFKILDGKTIHQHVVFEGRLLERESTK